MKEITFFVTLLIRVLFLLLCLLEYLLIFFTLFFLSFFLRTDSFNHQSFIAAFKSLIPPWLFKSTLQIIDSFSDQLLVLTSLSFSLSSTCFSILSCFMLLYIFVFYPISVSSLFRFFLLAFSPLLYVSCLFMFILLVYGRLASCFNEFLIYRFCMIYILSLVKITSAHFFALLFSRLILLLFRLIHHNLSFALHFILSSLTLPLLCFVQF